MKKDIIFFLSAIFIFISIPAFAQYGDYLNKDDEETAPQGMERKKISGGVYILMPKGGRFHRPNETLYVEESPAEYSSRKFTDMNERLNKLEETNKELVEKVKYLESKLVLQKTGADIDASKSTKK